MGDVDVPPGVSAGARLRARGAAGTDGSDVQADVVVRIRDDDPPFRRSGSNVLLDLTVSARQAAAGGQVEVPTLAGPRRLRIPPGTESGRILRLEGFGLPRADRVTFGDQLVRISVASPDGAPATGAAAATRPPVAGAAAAPGPAVPSAAAAPAIGGVAPDVPAPAPALPPRVRLTTRDVQHWLRRATATVITRLVRKLESRRQQPSQPLVAVLTRLSRAVERADDTEVRNREHLDRRLTEFRAELERLGTIVERHDEVVGRFEPGTEAPRAALIRLLVVMTGTAIVATLNTWIIQGVPTAAAAAGAADAVQDGSALRVGGIPWLIPLSLSLCATAIGMVLYGLDTVRAAWSNSRFIRGVRNLPILGLVLIHGIAYILVVEQLDLTASFGIDPIRTLYPVTQYTLVFVGAVVPLLLAVLGYAMWLNVDRYEAARSNMAVARQLDRSTRVMHRLSGRLADTAARMEVVGPAASESSAGVAARTRAGPADGQDLAESVRVAITSLRRTGRIGDAVPGPKSTLQTTIEWIADLLIVGLWILTTLVLARRFEDQLAGSGVLAPPDTAIAAVCMVLALAFAAFVARDALWGATHLSFWPEAAPTAGARKGVAVLALAAVAAGAMASAWAFATGYAGIADAALGVLYGLFLSVGLVLATMNLDRSLVTLAHTLAIAAYAATVVALGLARAVVGLFDLGVAAVRPARKRGVVAD